MATSRPPNLITLVCTLIGDQRFTGSGRANLLTKLPRLCANMNSHNLTWLAMVNWADYGIFPITLLIG